MSRTPGGIALSDRDHRYTFAELLASAEPLAAVLVQRGVRRGRRVVWWADSCSLKVVPFYYALAMLGGVFVPVKPRVNAHEAGAICDLVDPVLRVSDQSHDGDVTIDELIGGPDSGDSRQCPSLRGRS